MTLVDTHCHSGLDKYEPIDSLLYHMEKSGVERAVLIQHGGQTDNSYHVECLQQYPERLQSAMIVEADDDGTRIRHWAAQGYRRYSPGRRLPRPSRRPTGAVAHRRRARPRRQRPLLHGCPAQPAICRSHRYLCQSTHRHRTPGRCQGRCPTTVRTIRASTQAGAPPQSDHQAARLRRILSPALPFRHRAPFGAPSCGGIRAAARYVGQRLSARQFARGVRPLFALSDGVLCRFKRRRSRLDFW